LPAQTAFDRRTENMGLNDGTEAAPMSPEPEATIPGVPAKAGGRPRSERATRSVLDAVLALGEEIGFGNLTVEGISAQTGVAKTTIYRRWPNVSSLVVDALLVELSPGAPLELCATARVNLTRTMLNLARAFRGRQGKILRELICRSQNDAGLQEAIRSRLFAPRRAASRAMVMEGIKQGELRADVDVDVMLDALFGPIYFRLLVPHRGGVISDKYVAALVETVFAGIAST
jgi:AcrR family transcriptional regulator